MENEFVKDVNIKDKSDEDRKKDLVLSILKEKNSLDLANRNFEFADGELIDYYLYKMKAHQAKLDYLLKEAKVKNIEINRIDAVFLNQEKVV